MVPATRGRNTEREKVEDKRVNDRALPDAIRRHLASPLPGLDAQAEPDRAARSRPTGSRSSTYVRRPSASTTRSITCSPGTAVTRGSTVASNDDMAVGLAIAAQSSRPRSRALPRWTPHGSHAPGRERTTGLGHPGADGARITGDDTYLQPHPSQVARRSGSRRSSRRSR